MMIIIYHNSGASIDDSTFIIAIPYLMELIEQGGKLYVEGLDDPVINDSSKVGWFAVPEQVIKQADVAEPPELPMEIPRTITELNLDYFTVGNLPFSQHIGKITAANPSNAKPVTVRRRFMGQNYDYQCLISQSVKDMYTAGDLAIGDYVIVSFIEEHPNESEKQIAIVVDKVFKSW